MHAPALLRGITRRPGIWVFLGLVGMLGLLPAEAVAQRPFRINDHFYRNETARRAFFDRYAVTGEVGYSSGGALRDEGLLTSDNDLVLSFRFDYQLLEQLDLSAIFDAVGSNVGNSVSLSWVVIKYYRYLEYSDYAFRLAVDPASDGRVGFPQVDLAFLYTSMLSPVVSTDFAMGVRRVNIGYTEFVPAQPIGQDDPLILNPKRPTLLLTRAFGTELHLMLNYNVHFDPAGSNLFVAFLGEGGQYDVVDSPVSQRPSSGSLGDVAPDGGDAAAERATTYRGGTVWARLGMEFSRPSYQVSPFVSVPLQQWQPEADGDSWPQSRLHFGVRLMLR